MYHLLFEGLLFLNAAARSISHGIESVFICETQSSAENRTGFRLYLIIPIQGGKVNLRGAERQQHTACDREKMHRQTLRGAFLCLNQIGCFAWQERYFATFS
jgi:hypothetical protein